MATHSRIALTLLAAVSLAACTPLPSFLQPFTPEPPPAPKDPEVDPEVLSALDRSGMEINPGSQSTIPSGTHAIEAAEQTPQPSYVMLDDLPPPPNMTAHEDTAPEPLPRAPPPVDHLPPSPDTSAPRSSGKLAATQSESQKKMVAPPAPKSSQDPLEPAVVPEPTKAETPPADSPSLPIRKWIVIEGDTLVNTLAAWANTTDWQVRHASNYDWPIEAGAAIDGTFLDAVTFLARAFLNATPAPTFAAYRGNQVLVIHDNASRPR